MTNINLENPYRGVIHENQRFYLAARLNINSGVSANIKTNLNLDANSDPHFILCLNRFENAGIKYHRLYWSNDPVDFIEQPCDNDQNQGAVKMFYRTDSNNSYDLFYQTNLNYQKFDNTLTVYGLDNIKETSDINQQRNNNFSIIPGSDQNYNLDNNIYSSVVYDILTKGNNGQDWNFRKNVTTNSEGRSPIATFTDNNSVFEDLNSVAVKVSGVPSNANSNQLSLSGFTAATGYLTLDDIPGDSGIALMTQGANSEYFSYKKYDNNTSHIIFNKRGLFGSTQFTPNTSDTLTLTIAISNNKDNFATIKQILTTNYSAFVSYLDIFFVPTSSHSFLTGGRSLATIPNYILPTGAVEFFNYQTGTVYTNGLPMRALSFLTNYLNNSLPTNFGTTKMDSSYPLIPVYSTTNNVNSSSTVIWTSSHESLNSYYYNYCRGNDLCGN